MTNNRIIIIVIIMIVAFIMLLTINIPRYMYDVECGNEINIIYDISTLDIKETYELELLFRNPTDIEIINKIEEYNVETYEKCRVRRKGVIYKPLLSFQ